MRRVTFGHSPLCAPAPFFFKDHCYLVIPFVLYGVTFRLFQLFVIESSVAFAIASVVNATEVVVVEQVGSKCY